MIKNNFKINTFYLYYRLDCRINLVTAVPWHSGTTKLNGGRYDPLPVYEKKTVDLAQGLRCLIRIRI